MEREAFQASIFNELSTVIKALANPSRLAMVELLAQGERSVDALAEATGLTIANTSQHLQLLKKSRIIQGRKKGHFVYYGLINLEFLAMYRHLTTFATEEYGELKWLIHQRREEMGTRELLSLEELRISLQEKEVQLLDLRTEAEYELGHIPGAINVPFDRLNERIRELPTDQKVIVYCRGPICFLADEAVQLLRASGFQAMRCLDGYPEWRIKGLT